MEIHHPGLRSILDVLRRGESLSVGEFESLQRQLARLDGQDRPVSDTPGARGTTPASGSAAQPALDPTAALSAGSANRRGTAAFAASFGGRTVDFFRETREIFLSSVGIGTYRGAMDDETDAAYVAAIRGALRAGVNVIDTSLNYRCQRSERNVGAALRLFAAQDGGDREGVLVCTKAGFLTSGAIAPGSLRADEVAGTHCMAPAFLSDQLERSRRNLGLAVVDVYYLHNPETQLRFVDASMFASRMRRAFERLEQAVAEGLIAHYGVATWDGFFDGSLSLRSLESLAREVAGDRHHFGFVQLPVNLGMLDALRSLAGDEHNVLATADELGFTVLASASLLQGRSAADLPGWISGVIPDLATDAQRAIQFARSTPGVTCALAGMRDPRHVADNTAVTTTPPLSRERYRAAFSAHSVVGRSG
ncbi:aldo/keto reductase [Embleya sp. NPDC059259]|uniref:aldo/keto reductase n=1 Tax=unclassified Embleya TaxID=2699296 RepID=UPI003679730A